MKQWVLEYHFCFRSAYNMEDTYYFMNHHTYWTYEHMFQDVDCWHESIKNKFDQQQSTIVKEEDELSSSEQRESKPKDVLVQLEHLDVSVCLVDCRKDAPTTTTATQSELLNTKYPSDFSSIYVNKDINPTNQAATSRLLSTREKRHVCEYCGKQFRDHYGLNIHVRTHTGERPYFCDQCEFKCSHKSSLKTHIRTHTKEKPFSCNVCGKSFAQSCNLKTHQLTHTGSKQHKCDQCGKMFGQKSNLTQHLLTHSGDKQHKCEQCGKMFGQKSNLTQHLRTHSDDKPYGCNICGKMFRRSSGRVRHAKQCSNASKPSDS